MLCEERQKVKSGFCDDGISIDDKVIEFQKHRRNDDFKSLQKYYSSFQRFWHNKVKDLIDEDEFSLEWDSKLLHSVETYDQDRAIELCKLKGWSLNSKFNRWFYSSLRNMISNIKTSAFRGNKQPLVTCPVCLKEVSKIDDIHLKHIISLSDLPKTFKWGKDVYKTALKPYKDATVKTQNGWETVNWPWYLRDGTPAVVCPFTLKLYNYLDRMYIDKLPKKYKHYAVPYTWFDFQEEFPTAIIHSEIHRLDTNCAINSEHQKSDVSTNLRVFSKEFAEYTCGLDGLNRMPVDYENTISIIKKYSNNKVDKYILMCLAVGYSLQDICDELEITRKDLQSRILELKNNVNLKNTLMETA